MYRLPAKWLLGFWFILQLLSSLATDPAHGSVAFWAHVGGFVAGALLILLFRDADFTFANRARRRSVIPTVTSNS